MPNYDDERSRSQPFRNNTDQQDRRASHKDEAPHIPHNQLVRHFQRFIAQQQEENRRHGFTTSPAHIIRSKLDHESGTAHTDLQTRTQAFNFWQPLISAWGAVAYDRYDPDSLEWTLATNKLSGAYEATRLYPRREPAIQLTRYQAGIINALTEAAGIRHKKGQTAIAIAETVKAISKSWQKRMTDTWLQMCEGKPHKP